MQGEAGPGHEPKARVKLSQPRANLQVDSEAAKAFPRKRPEHKAFDLRLPESKANRLVFLRDFLRAGFSLAA